MDNPKLILLSKARGADGELIFPDLTNTMGFIQPDIMPYLIAACDTVKLDKYCDGWQCWITIEDNDWTVSEVYGSAEYHGSQAETIHVALIDALFQATAALEPDNWEKCGDCEHGEVLVLGPPGRVSPRRATHGVCGGTGWVLAP